MNYTGKYASEANLSNILPGKKGPFNKGQSQPPSSAAVLFIYLICTNVSYSWFYKSLNVVNMRIGVLILYISRECGYYSIWFLLDTPMIYICLKHFTLDSDNYCLAPTLHRFTFLAYKYINPAMVIVNSCRHLNSYKFSVLGKFQA